MGSNQSRTEGIAIAVLALIGLVVLPCLNAFTPESSPFHVTTFALSVYGKYQIGRAHV